MLLQGTCSKLAQSGMDAFERCLAALETAKAHIEGDKDFSVVEMCIQNLQEDAKMPIEVASISCQEEDVPAELPSVTVEDVQMSAEVASLSGQEEDVPAELSSVKAEHVQMPVEVV